MTFKPRMICGELRRHESEAGYVSTQPCGGTFKPAVERLTEHGTWVLGMGAKMRHSPSKLQCQQCGRIA